MPCQYTFRQGLPGNEWRDLSGHDVAPHLIEETHMRTVVLHAPKDVRVEQQAEPRIEAPTDAVIRVSAACVCGSDLWPYRGVEEAHDRRMGHEYVGVVEEVGDDVRNVRPGEFVVGSFFASDNTCEICRAGYQTHCVNRQAAAPDGAQADRVRIALAAEQLGAERIVIFSRHEPRQKLAREFGATDVIAERGDEGVAKLKDLFGGLGAHSVVEAVGTQESLMQAIRATRPGGHVGYVGVSHGVELPGQELFFSHVHLHGGPAPVRRFLPELIELIWRREIDPGKVFDLELPLDRAAEGYRAMDERRAIKTLLRP